MDWWGTQGLGLCQVVDIKKITKKKRTHLITTLLVSFATAAAEGQRQQQRLVGVCASLDEIILPDKEAVS